MPLEIVIDPTLGYGASSHTVFPTVSEAVQRMSSGGLFGAASVNKAKVVLWETPDLSVEEIKKSIPKGKSLLVVLPLLDGRTKFGKQAKKEGVQDLTPKEVDRKDEIQDLILDNRLDEAIQALKGLDDTDVYPLVLRLSTALFNRLLHISHVPITNNWERIQAGKASIPQNRAEFLCLKLMQMRDEVLLSVPASTLKLQLIIKETMNVY